MINYAPPVSTNAAKEITLRSAEFRRAREDSWKKLADMLERVERSGIGALSASESTEIALLYRSAVSSLSVARNIALDRGLLLYLENLTLRAYLVVYGPRTGAVSNIAEFFMRGWPRAVRSVRRPLLAAVTAFFVGVIAGYVMVSRDVNNFGLFVSESVAQGRGPASTRSELMNEELFAPWPGFVKTFVVFANSLFRHNARIGILCFGLGFLLGVPTIFLIVSNGAVLGAFTALHAEKELAVDFIGWLSIHGVTEILAVLLAGAAGLAVAHSIIFPGAMSRTDSLASAGRHIAVTVVGCVLMFFIAGIIEGGFRQLIAHTPGRYAFAAATAVLWTCYFVCAGRVKDGAEN
ncbi:MAG: stage II sporulation protein M [Synergistaceae bacterium]|jgi:uncharacterized membrane protein SpoIIM required for sporulation|nr:stage II sporulation protein M [Synergistaceae bacterium]